MKTIGRSVRPGWNSIPTALVALLTSLAATTLAPGSLQAAGVRQSVQDRVGRPPDQVGPHSLVWHDVGRPASEVAMANPAGTNDSASMPRGRGRVEMIETGMNFWDGQGWAASEPVFEMTTDGFVANRVQHQPRIAANLNRPGAVTLYASGGRPIRSTPVALGWFDAASGRSVEIARLVDCAGMLVASNQVLFARAFDHVDASVVFTLQKGSFEQDIVLREPLDPATYGMDAATARLCVYTEFYDPPRPERTRRPLRVEERLKVRQQMVQPDFVDEMLTFGNLSFTTGHAFRVGQCRERSGAAVAKEWNVLRGEASPFLIESVEYPDIRDEMEALAARWAARGGVPDEEDGLVIDYVVYLDQDNQGESTVFRGDTTYYLAGPVTCNSARTIEGGAVFKYAKTPTLNPVNPTTYLKFNYPVTCKTSSYFPAIFTAADDATIGQNLGNGPPNTTDGHYAYPAVWFSYVSAPALNNLRISYAEEAIRIEGGHGTSASVSHAQLVNCIKGITITGGGCGSGCGVSVTVHNCLMANIKNPLTAKFLTYGYLYHCTVDGRTDNTTCLATATAGANFTFMNSVFSRINTKSAGNPMPTVGGSYNGFHASDNALFGSTSTRWTYGGTSPFQSEGGANHYLTDASGFRGKGTTAVGSTRLNTLKTRTTYPPISFPAGMTLAGDLALYPQVPRYVSGPPDLGYWYDALDFTVADMVLEGGAVIVHPGTAIGFDKKDFYWSFKMRKGSSFSSLGTPTRPNTFVSVPLVQEGPFEIGNLAGFLIDSEPVGGEASPPRMQFRFSHFYLPWDDWLFWGGWDETRSVAFGKACTTDLTLRDCVVRGGNINFGKAQDCLVPQTGRLVWINNLFEQVHLNLDPDWVAWFGAPLTHDISFLARNNLFRRGRLRIVPLPASAGHWTLTDNLFDKTIFCQDTTQPLDHDYNGYWPRTEQELYDDSQTWDSEAIGRLAPVADGGSDAANDKVLTAAPAYQVGSLGDRYLPASGPLYNGGSRTPGEAGLYHYTTRLDQKKDGEETETPNKVNIGFHYVATVNGQPKDTDSDGIPDYVEDADGDGLLDPATETSPTSPDSDGDGVLDPHSMVYRVADLDGDGLNGCAEGTLGADPLSCNGSLALTPVNTGREPQIQTLRTTLSAASLTAEEGTVTLMSDGEPVSAQRTFVGPDGCYWIAWNTLFNPLGIHVLNARLELIPGAGRLLDDGTPSHTSPGRNAVGRPVLYSSESPLYFKVNYTGFSSYGYLPIYAQSSAPEASYVITFKDGNGAFLGSVEGTSSAGTIDTYWDMIKPDGTQYTGEALQATFELSENGVPAPHPPTCHFYWCRVYDGDFTVAHCYEDEELSFTLSDTYQQEWWGSLLGRVVNPLLWPDGDTPTYNSSFNTPAIPWVPPGNSGYLDWRSALPSQEALLANLALPNTRNFHFDGHGSPISFGNNIMGENAITITWNVLAERLGNKCDEEDVVMNHPYRFVFLDCCEAGTVKFSIAFGSIGAPPDAEMLDRCPYQVQGFLGFLRQSPLPGNSTEIKQLTTSLDVFYRQWMHEFPLEQCVTMACSEDPYGDGSLILKWPLNKKLKQLWWVPEFLAADPMLRIYGYKKITRSGFER